MSESRTLKQRAAMLDAYKQFIRALVIDDIILIKAEDRQSCCVRNNLTQYVDTITEDSVWAWPDTEEEPEMRDDYQTTPQQNQYRTAKDGGDEFLKEMLNIATSRKYQCQDCFSYFLEEEAKRLPQGEEDDDDYEY
jgi:hypothetical protein